MKKLLVIGSAVALTLFTACGNKEQAQPDNQVIVENEASKDEKEGVDDAALSSTTGEAEETQADKRTLNANKRVICWGTSLTEGTGGGGVTMPNVLDRISGANVLNYGGYAENTNEIATRSGASILTLDTDITIPAYDDAIDISFSTEFGDTPRILKYTDSGLNPVTISGITGNIYREEDEDGNASFHFYRLEAGEETSIPAGTQIISYTATDKREDDINVIWTAGNDNLQNTEDIQALLDKIDKMIDYSGSDKYVIVSEMNTHEEIPVTDEVNDMFEEHYGEHFVHLRKYFIEEAFDDLGITPSNDDLEDISAWEIPRYFRIDEVHGNSLYYYLAGQQVYIKCQELGYLE